MSTEINVEAEYIVDREGRKTKIILPIEAYEELLKAAQQPNEAPQAQTRIFKSLGAGEDTALQGAETRDLIAQAWKAR